VAFVVAPVAMKARVMSRLVKIHEIIYSHLEWLRIAAAVDTIKEVRPMAMPAFYQPTRDCQAGGFSPHSPSWSGEGILATIGSRR
jgi:hypothetical protein